MYKFHNQLLPTAFHSFFTKVTNIHKYNTRLAAKQSYYLPLTPDDFTLNSCWINARLHNFKIAREQGAIFSAICRRDIAGVSNMFET